MKLPPILTPDGRRAWAFLALLGGSIVMTVFAAVGVYIVRKDSGLSFWLAMAAHVQIIVGMTGFGALLYKRTIKAGRDGVEISDQGEGDV
jgi:hypothetical protein